MSLRIAIIGTGRVAKARLREIHLRHDARVVAVVSRDIERAKQLIDGQPEIEVIEHWPSLLTRTDIDAVMVCTINQLHAEICAAGLQAGKHVSVDYPLALSLSDTQRLMQLATQANRVLHVEHIELLSPWFNVIKDHLHSIGELMVINWQHHSARQADSNDWTFDTASGFTFFQQASILSRLIWLAGTPDWIDAQERLFDLSDSKFTGRLTTATIGFANGIIGQITDATGLGTAGHNSRLEIVGRQGIITGEAHKRVTLSLADSVTELPLPARIGLFAQDIEAFVNAVVTGAPTYAPLSHVKSLMALADAGERSCRQHQRISLN